MGINLESLLRTGGGQKLLRLLDVAKTMAHERRIDKLLPFIADRVAESLEADRCAIFLLDKDKNEIWSMVATGEQGEIRFPVGTGIAGHVIQTGTTLHIPDAYKDERFHQGIDSKTGYKTRNILAAPLVNMSGEVIGCFEVINKIDGDFGEHDETFLLAFGSHAAAAIESAQLIHRNHLIIDELMAARANLENKVKQMQVVLKTEQQVNVAESLNDFMQVAIENAAKACSADAGSILLLDANERQLLFSSQVGDDSQNLKQMRLAADEGIAGHVFETGKPILDNEAAQNPLHSKRIDAALHRQTKSIIAVPLIDDGKTVGVLEVINSQSKFTPEDLDFLNIVSAQITSMIERRRLLDQRDLSNRLATIGQLSSSILHDLKNPMAAIKGFAELLGGKTPSEDERREFSEIIVGQVDRCVSMTKEVLSFARGDRQYNFTPIDAPAMFRDIEMILNVETSRLGRHLTVTVGDIGPWEGDGERLKRVIFNLTNNAIEATPRGGKIDVSCARLDDMIEIRVRDDGKGVPEAIRTTLFEAFATSNKLGGTGLGLHIAKDIIQNHGGTISLDPAVEKGACFVIRLPPSPPKPAAPS